MFWLPYSSHTSNHPSQTPCLPWISYANKKTYACFMQDGRKAVWSIQCFSSIFLKYKTDFSFISYRSSKLSSRPDCIFEIHQLWQSFFSRVYSNCFCRCSFEPEIIKIGMSSHKIYINNILNFQVYTQTLNTCTKKSGNLLNAPRIYMHMWIYIYIYIYI